MLQTTKQNVAEEKKMKKRMCGFFCIMMTLVTLMLTVCPAMAVDKTMRGHFGDDLIWLFTPGNSTLTVKGEGEMASRLHYEGDFYGTVSPWDARGISDQIRKVVIEEGVTSVGSAMFEGCSALEEISLPQSLTRINPMAFAYTAVKAIVIPENVVYVGDGAFSHCQNLRSVKCEARHAMEIGTDVFYDTPFLSGDTYDENGLLLSGSHLLAADHALQGTCVIPEGVTDIAGYAFSGYVELGDPEGMPGLTEVVFPCSLEYVGPFAFGGCSALKHVVMPYEDIRFACHPFCNTGLPEDMIEEYRKKSECCWDSDETEPASETVYIGASDTQYPMGSYRRVGEWGREDILKAYTVDPDNPYFKAVDGVLYSKNGAVLLRVPGGRDDDVFVVPDGVRVIGDSAFYHEYSETSVGPRRVILPEGVTVIREYAFCGCSNLESVTLPSTLKTIDACAFSDTGLTQIDLPDGLEEIGDCAFTDTKFTSIRIPESVECIRGGTFAGAAVEQIDGFDRVPYTTLYGMERQMFSGTPYERALEETAAPADDAAEPELTAEDEDEDDRGSFSPYMYITYGGNVMPRTEVHVKTKLFRGYGSQRLHLNSEVHGYADCDRLTWRSDNDKVFVDANGNVTNRLHHADSAVITLAVLDAEGRTLEETSVRLYFYRFDHQLRSLQAKYDAR